MSATTSPTSIPAQPSPQAQQDPQPETSSRSPAHINLPPEIRHQIVSSIEYEAPSHAKVPPRLIMDLLACCVASGQWRDAAAPVLANAFRKWNSNNFEEAEILNLVRLVSQLLEVSPDTLACCEKVKMTITLLSKPAVVFSHNVEDAIIEIVRMLPGLRSVTVRVLKSELEEHKIYSLKRQMDLLSRQREHTRQFLARIQAAACQKTRRLKVYQFTKVCEGPSPGFAPTLMAMPSLRELKLHVIDTIEMEAILMAVGSTSPHIEVLDLTLATNYITLDRFVETMPALKVLRIKCQSHNHVTEKLLENLAKNCPELQEFVIPLVLDWFGPLAFDTQWDHNLIHVLESCPNLRKLDLTFRDIGDALLVVLVTRTPSLEHLVLHDCHKLTGTPLLAAAAPIDLPHLRFLDLRKCSWLKPNAVQLLVSSAPRLEVLLLPSSFDNHHDLTIHLESILGLVRDEDLDENGFRTHGWVRPSLVERRRGQENQNKKRKAHMSYIRTQNVY